MDLKVNIFDLLGRKVNTIERTKTIPGKVFINWDGKNVNGQKLGSGVYFAIPASSEKLDVIKIVLLKK
jgi:flagellar hook assembly protein FlgD